MVRVPFASMICAAALIACTGSTDSKPVPSLTSTPESPTRTASVVPPDSAEATATPNETVTPELTACEDAFRVAAEVPSDRDVVEDLDPALLACASLPEWDSAASKFPDALDGVSAEQFARNRCQLDGALAAVSLCKELIGEISSDEARDQVVSCLAALPASGAITEEIGQLQSGISSLRIEGAWFIERSDPAKFDLAGFPLVGSEGFRDGHRDQRCSSRVDSGG